MDNEIRLIDNFWAMTEIHSLLPNDIALYFYLVRINRRCSWIELFNHNNYKIMAMIGVKDVRTLNNSRNKLKQVGLIDFKSNSGSAVVNYKLLGLKTSIKNMTTGKNTEQNNANLCKKCGGLCRGLCRTSVEVDVELLSSKDTIINNSIYKEKAKDLFFSKIENFENLFFLFEGNKKYLLLAYRFWEVYRQREPNSQTLEKAKVHDWVDTIRLIIEVDKQPINRLIGILIYFREIVNGANYDDFWLKNCKTIAGIRKKNKDGIYKIDQIIEQVNTTMDKDVEFEKKVSTAIKKNESSKLLETAV